MNNKEGIKWLLQKIYNKGFKYIIFDSACGGYFGLDKLPIECDERYKYNGVNRCGVNLIADLLPDFNEPNYLDIGKYLGIVDWSKVAVDTPIIVKYNGQDTHRHFSYYRDNRVYFYPDGKTSWTATSKEWTNPICVTLAGGNDEK